MLLGPQFLLDLISSLISDILGLTRLPTIQELDLGIFVIVGVPPGLGPALGEQVEIVAACEFQKGVGMPFLQGLL